MTLPFEENLPPNLPHEWVGATNLRLDRRRAEQATKTGKVTLTSKATVEVLDVFCAKCRRSYEDVKDQMAKAPKGAPWNCVTGSQHFGGPRRQPDPLVLTTERDWPEPHDPLNGHDRTIRGL